ncbi:MAG: hypothetical protein EHM61_25725 [Acidobacteria bacterium]|nr:MAG: hypothetical protein EHM61_25725 [Acidobacteriota bacterium]
MDTMTARFDADLPSRDAELRKMDRRIFLACTFYTVLATLVWLYFVISQRDGGVLFRQYNITWESVASVLGAIFIFWCGWSGLWYWIKRRLLRRLGLSKEELDAVFSTRDGDFRLQELTAKYPERKIRILDMIGRRGRAAIMATVGFVILYLAIRKSPGPESLAFGIQNNFFESLVFGWWMILTYYSNGFLGKVTYGAQARIMDGRLARANCLLIGTLWGMFKFVMIPIGIQLGAVFPSEYYAVLFLFIWISYLVGDTASEVVGSMWGRQKLRVWGVGEVNRKSVEGTVACFLGAFLVCVWGVYSHDLSVAWLALALVIGISNTLVELWSPRGTDDFLLATSNALLCLGFGAWFL